MTRLSQAQLIQLESRLSDRRRQLIQAVADFRLISGGQLLNLVAPSPTATQARLLRLDLAALTANGCLHRLDRQIGGVRSGSTGYLYSLGAVGGRLVDFWSGAGIAKPRTRYEPSTGFQDHALAVSGCVIDIVRAARAGGARTTYRVERGAWRTHLGAGGARRVLKPDAELVIEHPDFTDHWWLEIDRATERRAALQRQLSAYVDYYRSGIEQHDHGVFPLVAWLTTTTKRAGVLGDVIDRLPSDGRELFRVGLIETAAHDILNGFGGTQ